MTWWRGLEADALHQALEAHFGTLAEGILARFPDFNRAVVHVSQYWDDQADDEVHATIVLETERADGPHECDAGLDSLCEDCDVAFDLYDGLYSQLIGFGWDSLYQPLQALLTPYCVEGARQTQDTSDAFRPYLSFERDRDQPEFIGTLYRPWLMAGRLNIEPPPPELAPLFETVYAHPADEGPRLVLADLLQSRGNPRGRFIALQMQDNPTSAMRAEAAQLWRTYRERWLGRFLAMAAPDECVARRGFVSRLAFSAPRGLSPTAEQALFCAPEWNLIEHLVLDDDRGYRLIPRMQYIDALTVPDVALQAMAKMGSWHCEDLRLPGRYPDILAGLSLPALRALVLSNTHRRLPITAAWWAQLEELTVTASTPGVIVQALSHPSAMVQFTYRISPTDAVQGKRSAPFHLQLTCADPEALSASFVDSLIYTMLSHGSGWQIEAQLTDAQIERLNAIGTARWIGLESA